MRKRMKKIQSQYESNSLNNQPLKDNFFNDSPDLNQNINLPIDNSDISNNGQNDPFIPYQQENLQGAIENVKKKPTLSYAEEILKQKRKQIIQMMREQNSSQQAIFQRLIAEQENQVYQETQMDVNQTAVQKNVKNLTIRLFNFLISAIDTRPLLYSPVLQKFIQSEYENITELLISTIIDLFKKQKVQYLWIIEYCLNIPIKYSSSKQQKNIKPQKQQFIQQLVDSGLFEKMLSTLAHNRFKKKIVEKVLYIFQIASKIYKPLQIKYIQMLWKIIGMNFQDQKQKQQFFIFIKECLKYQEALTQEAVEYIYYDIFLQIHPNWFSSKIFECFLTLFLRLNEDFELLSYNPTRYSFQINDKDLIGLQKLWEIYFEAEDSRVITESKQFLSRLSTYSEHSVAVQQPFSNKYCKLFMQYMRQLDNPQAQGKIERFERGLNFIDRFVQKTLNKSSPSKQSQGVKITIINQIPRTQPQKIELPKISKKIFVPNLKDIIIFKIQPRPNSNDTVLLLDGNILDEEETLNKYSLQQNLVLVITEKNSLEGLDNSQDDQNLPILIELKEFVGSEFQDDFLKFVINKMGPQNLENIVHSLFDQSLIINLQQDYSVNNNRKIKQKRKKALVSPKQPIFQFSFCKQLVQTAQIIKFLFQSCEKYGVKRGWETISRLPFSTIQQQKINNFVINSEWSSIFETKSIMQKIYNTHLLMAQLTKPNKKSQIKSKIFQQNMKVGFNYITTLLKRQLSGNQNPIFSSLLSQILLSQIHKNFKLKLLRDYERIKPNDIHADLRIKLFDQFILENQKNHLYCFSQMENQGYAQDNMQSRGSEILLKSLLEAIDQEIFCVILEFVSNSGNYWPQNISLCGLLVQILFFKLTASEKDFKIIIDMDENSIYSFLKFHGFFAEYIILFCLSLCIQKQQDGINDLQIFMEKLAKIIFSSEQSDRETIPALYDTISNLLGNSTLNLKDVQLLFTQKIAIFSMNEFEKLSAAKLSYLLQILRICLERLFQNCQLDCSQPDIYEPITNFVYKGIQKFLFQLSNSHFHTRNKQIRRNFFDIISLVLDYSLSDLQLQNNIIEKLSGISLKKKEAIEDEDNLNFTNQKYLGLKNLGATCYINSLIQQLYHTKFSKLLIQQQVPPLIQNQARNSEQVIKMKQLKVLFMRLYCSLKRQINPIKFIKSIKFYGQQINPHVQQDASEFLLCIFDYIQSQGYQSQVYDVFGGNLCNQITAKQNEKIFTKNNFEHFNTLTIDIKNKRNLNEALEYFIKPQRLDGDNMYYCEQLGKKTIAIKRTFIQTMPNILILTLKRFQFNYQTNSRRKLNDYFEFPIELDMHKYSEDYLKNKTETSNSQYRLVGITVHSGSAESGHYYSFIDIGNKWYEFNDCYVTQFNIDAHLKNQCFGCSDGKKSRCAYIVFYEKINSDCHRARLNQISDTNLIKQLVNIQNSQLLKNSLVTDQNFVNLVKKLHSITSSQKLSHLLGQIINTQQENFLNVMNEPQLEQVPLDKENNSFEQMKQITSSIMCYPGDNNLNMGDQFFD